MGQRSNRSFQKDTMPVISSVAFHPQFQIFEPMSIVDNKKFFKHNSQFFFGSP